MTILLLLLAGAAFTFRFFTANTAQSICDVLAFALPTMAALVEIIVDEKRNRKFTDELKNGPMFEYLNEDEYERRNAE